MRVDTFLGGLADAAERSRAAEAAGFDGVRTGEMNGDPFLPLAIAAEVTERLDIGTSIAVAFARSPMTLAYTAADLQRHSRGRLHLGLGSQVKAHVQRRFGMPWGRPAPQLREYVSALRAIWAAWAEGSPLAFEGEYYRHTLMPRDFVPPRHEYGPPRVLLAGVGEAMTRVAGEVADGFLCHGFTTARWIRERTLPALRAGRARSGADLDGFDIVATPFVVTGTAQQIAEGVPKARARIAFYASTPAYRGIFALHGWDGVNEALTALSKAGRWAEMPALITDEMLDAFVVVAPPAELPQRLADRFGGLLTRLSFTPPAGFGAEQTAELVHRLRAL
ncbi:TIGR03617 family F420-dependent LLM class oxidoreductase [Nocardia sp. alder85J]|uniref:TIGR03617 family F420-dependent LLM class oxidoreductase n=1 Tax=Nocardia sp. alder85J TaxID=2862949 RepID=UPI001CD7287D|nr:TIGR03617 family F420-dependent LLM class oxidoreductase [Nocardia sp. alder85J]MCX4090747.1 TIGR03617 family F420-dependent LLM class oxidoreductase [Nocardia sp. alder85J]